MSEFKPHFKVLEVIPVLITPLKLGEKYDKGVIIQKGYASLAICYSQTIENCKICPLNKTCPAALKSN